MKFLILGAGRQGFGIVHDLLRSDRPEIVVVDRDPGALDCVARQWPGVRTEALDVNELGLIARLMAGSDVCVSAVPYFYNLVLARTAIENAVHFCDLGGSTQIVLKELQLGAAASSAGIAVVPDCGLAPGLTNVLAARAFSRLETVHTLEVRAGALPVHPTVSLLAQYMEPTGYLEDGVFKKTDSLTGVEDLRFEGLPALEAFYTHSIISTLPESYAGKVRNLTAKTVGDKGWAAMMRSVVRDPSFKSRTEIAAYLKKTQRQNDPDMLVARVTAVGLGKVTFEVVQINDAGSEISAEIQISGSSASIVAQLLAAGRIPPGAHVLEKVIEPAEFIHQLENRGIQVHERLEA